MYTSSLLLAALPVVFAASSSTSSSGAASTTASATSGIATVAVGQGGNLAFSPNSLTAAVGSVVEFQFYPKIHSVAQAAFADPCEPLANNTGFFSGSLQTTGTVNATVFAITVNDTKPIWFYCGYPGHCEAGMVGVINPPSDGSKTVEMFAQAAQAKNATIAPKVVQGGFKGAASAVTVPSSTGSSTTSSSTSSSTSKANAGVESRGTIRWSLLGLTGVVAAGVSSLII